MTPLPPIKATTTSTAQPPALWKGRIISVYTISVPLPTPRVSDRDLLARKAEAQARAKLLQAQLANSET